MKTNTITKVAKDMYIEQLKWSIWFICSIIAVYIGLNVAGSYYNFSAISDLLMYTAGSSVVYMFVIGIIAGATFLQQFKKLGVTRKICVYGMAVAALYLSITLPLVFNLFALVESLFTGLFEFNFASFILYVLTIYVGYIFGWLISIGFYKFNWIIGLFFIAFTVVLNILYELILKSDIFSLNEADLLDINFEASLQISSISYYQFIGKLLIIIITLLIIRLLTKNMQIKLK